MALWLKEGEDTDVAVSTRARLARNIEGLPFPAVIRGTPKAKQVTTPAIETFVEGADFRLINMSETSPVERARLKEDHIISNELEKAVDGAVIVSPDESLSIMLMEEDDYRLQCILPGLQTAKALSLVRELDKMLGKNVRYAYDDELGFLTGCITNVGTGLRMSAMLHLPALTMTGMMGRLITQIAKLGITVRGIYGEGSGALGNIYQVSNQLTLGLSEDEIVSNVNTVVMNLISRERNMRKRLLSENGSLRDENQNLTEAGKKLHKSIIIAESQTAGRGRSGRTFVSPEKTGIYITLIYAPAGGVSQGTRITAFTAVAICRAIKKIYKIQPSIKWINDIFVEGKKAGGILTEGTANFETGLIESAVIGIGLNISKNPDAFSGDLANIAGSIVQDGQSKVSRIEFAAEVGAQVLSVLEENPGDVLAEYKDYSFIIGNKVVVHSLIDNEKGDYFAKVVDIDENAGLVVETEDGTVKTLVSGEVSLRSSQFTK